MSVEIRLVQVNPIDGISSATTLASLPIERSGFYGLATGEQALVIFDMNSTPKKIIVDGLQDPLLRGRSGRVTRTVQIDFFGVGVTNTGEGISLEIDLGRTALYRVRKYRREELERREQVKERNRIAAVRLEPIQRRSDLVHEHEVIEKADYPLRVLTADRSYEHMRASGVPRNLQYEPYPYLHDPRVDFDGNPLSDDKYRILSTLPKDDEKRGAFHQLVDEAKQLNSDIAGDGSDKTLSDFIDRRLEELGIFRVSQPFQTQ